MKILVVDDEKVLVKGIKFNLESEGYQVEAGYDGEEAVELARSGSFDLIILDLMMPKIDGLQACMRIREFSNVPIIMLTARSEDTAPSAQSKEDTLAGGAKINLNTAGVDELMTLPGIGEKRAEDIIAYRRANGPFRIPEELTEVPGIGEGILEGLIDYVTTGEENR